MKIKILVVEDQENQYEDIVKKIKGFSIFELEIIDYGPTKELTYSAYIENLKNEPSLPLIILVDYELVWKGRSSSANGQNFIDEIIKYYPKNTPPFIIYISKPYTQEIRKSANDFEFINEKTNALALDKSEFDNIHSKNKTKLNFTIEKGIHYLKNNGFIMVPIEFNNLFHYPDLDGLEVGSYIKRDFFKLDLYKEKFKDSFEVGNLLMIIFKTDSAEDFMLIMAFNDGKMKRYLKPIDRVTKSAWINKLRVAGLDFMEKGNIFYNPYYFKDEENKLRAKENPTFELIDEVFKLEFSFNEHGSFKHPFKKYIKSILPPKEFDLDFLDKSL